MQQSCFLKLLFQFKFLWRKGSLNIISFVSKSAINPEKTQKVWRLIIIHNKFLGYSKWKGSVPDVMFWTWQFKGEKKITSLHSYLKRSMPETLFGTLTNLLYSVQNTFQLELLLYRTRHDFQCKTVLRKVLLQFFKNVFVFQKIKANVFKTFKNFTDFHIKTCWSLKQRAILKILGTVF